jgi:hypothetical protein
MQKTTVFNRYYHQDIKNLIGNLVNPEDKEGRDYFALVNTVGNTYDVFEYFTKIREKCNRDTRLIVIYYNHIWEPIIKIAEMTGIKAKQSEQNWLAPEDVRNLLEQADFSVIKKGERLLIPINIPILSYLVNKYLAKLPLLNNLCLTNYLVARPINFKKDKEYTVSVVIPARNEEGTIPQIMPRLPRMGIWTEAVFVEGHSRDKTWEAILSEKQKYPGERIRVLKQKGIGKADAVRAGIAEAQGEIIMILDADLSVQPEELAKFYKFIAEGRGEFLNGTRMVYPLEKESMRFLNQIGNKIFGILFTWILKRRFTDTLCGTKVFWKKDYARILELRKVFGDFDPFGDYELIFGATKLNLETTEIPVHYKPRVYGRTNISRFAHGGLLLKMCMFAIKKFKWDE